MPSTLAWLDYDSNERERTQRILALFREREFRDEPGLGATRDSFTDQLFPGTRTIQTQLRYVLFIPWMYMGLEDQGVPGSQIAAKARKFEIDMINPLLAQEDRAGVFGRVAKDRLKKLPSSVYWAALGSWGIRRFAGSQEGYYGALDRIYRQRVQAGRPEDRDLESGPSTWDRKIVQAPAGFPASPSTKLTPGEAASRPHDSSNDGPSFRARSGSTAVLWGFGAEQALRGSSPD
jgi:hypothetical protein